MGTKWKSKNFGKSYLYTVWKYHDFPITQILREINFGESRSSKTLPFFEGVNFV